MSGSSTALRGRSRALTPTEVLVLRGLLSAGAESEKSKIRRLGVPPRTYHSIRERAYTEGWVMDRYLPDLELVRASKLTVAVVQPFTEQIPALVQSWEADPRTVLLWVGAESVFAVFVEKPGKGPGLGKSLEEQATKTRRQFSVTADTQGDGVPVYFDFEGVWSRWTGLPGCETYPQPWVSSERSEGRNQLGNNGLGTAILDLVRRPFDVEKRGESPLRAGPYYAPRSQQKVLQRGWVRRRILLDILRVPGFEGRTIERVVFIGGSLMPGREPAEMFQQLVSRCQVSPFLFVTDHQRVLMAALSPGPKGGPATDGRGRVAVMALLQQYLHSIEVIREPLSTLRSVVSHRYDRLFQG